MSSLKRVLACVAVGVVIGLSILVIEYNKECRDLRLRLHYIVQNAIANELAICNEYNPNADCIQRLMKDLESLNEFKKEQLDNVHCL